MAETVGRPKPFGIRTKEGRFANLRGTLIDNASLFMLLEAKTKRSGIM